MGEEAVIERSVEYHRVIPTPAAQRAFITSSSGKVALPWYKVDGGTLTAAALK